MEAAATRPKWTMLGALAGLALALLGGVAGWAYGSHRFASNPAAALAAGDRAAIEQVVHDYILAHPEVLPQAIDNLRRNESAKQLAGVKDEVFAAFPDAVLGNPHGKLTIVEFTDYACTFCRRSVADLEQLIAADPELRVVVRELPILSPESGDAARLALAAARQGRYAAFHHVMFEIGRPDPATMEAAAKAAGIDLVRARKATTDPAIAAEISRNMDLARRLGFEGTPSWVIGNQLLSGAVGKDRLAQAIAAARG